MSLPAEATEDGDPGGTARGLAVAAAEAAVSVRLCSSISASAEGRLCMSRWRGWRLPCVGSGTAAPAPAAASSASESDESLTLTLPLRRVLRASEKPKGGEPGVSGPSETSWGGRAAPVARARARR
jgi:hypothetical protein